MDPNTGAIIDGDDEALKKIEQELKRDLVRIPKEDVDKVRAMTMQDRRAYAKKVEARRKKTKAAKAAKRKNRK